MEKYKKLDTPYNHFEMYYQLFLKSKLKNKEEFIVDFLSSIDLFDIETIITNNRCNSRIE